MPFNIISRLNNVAKFSPTKLRQIEFLTNKGINSYLFTEGALNFSPTKRNLLSILEISHQPVGEKCHAIEPGIIYNNSLCHSSKLIHFLMELK